MATKKGRNYRKKEDDSDSEGEEKYLIATLEDIRGLQKLRTKSAGLSAVELALGKEVPKEVEFISSSDPFKLKTGGVIDLKKIKQSDLNKADIEDNIKQTFSKESHLRDEDEEMRKYVEEELARQKGRERGAEPKTEPEDDLYQLPERLQKYQSRRNEEMLSNQMLCGIPEVDLGIDAKIRNIEETEAAKLRLLREARERKRTLEVATTATQDLVKNLSSDYVQHKIYNISKTTDLGSEKKQKLERGTTEGPVPVVGEDTPKWVLDGRTVPRPQNPLALPKHLKSSDKECYDKFKRKFVKPKK